LAQPGAGKSVFFVHPAGKSGTQRGSSRKEDVLDTVINLRRPPDYSPDRNCFLSLKAGSGAPSSVIPLSSPQRHDEPTATVKMVTLASEEVINCGALLQPQTAPLAACRW